MRATVNPRSTVRQAAPIIGALGPGAHSCALWAGGVVDVVLGVVVGLVVELVVGLVVGLSDGLGDGLGAGVGSPEP